MNRCFVIALSCAVLLFPVEDRTAAAEDRPIQALLVTGGCCHDYDRQKLILTRGISARANVRWTVVHQGGKTTNTKIPLYDDPDWADGFDIVVHNECFAGVKDTEFVDRILKPHKEGTPAILIHCAMHCYRTGDNRWFEFVGLKSPGHGPHYSYKAENVKTDHPIMKDFGPAFIAPKGELYHAVEVFDTATPLAQANRQSDGMPQVCVWTNDYRPGRGRESFSDQKDADGEESSSDSSDTARSSSEKDSRPPVEGTRVFGCTIGHYNETMVEPKYLDMMTRGLLWATGRDPEKHFTPTTEAIDEELRTLATIEVAKNSGSPASPGNCCGDTNVALGKPVTSKSVQSGNNREHLTDGRLDKRWCANGAQGNEWVTVDLEEPQSIKNIRIHWERRKGTAYRYTVETSVDEEAWETVVDASKNEDTNGVRTHAVDLDKVRYFRTTFLSSSTGGWGSIWEFEASAGELADLGDLVNESGQPASTIADVKAPEGFEVTMFGSPPEVNYPVCITASVDGEVFVGVDEMGSLGKEPGRGKVLRCVDTDGDGTADDIKEFAKMDHPRGLIYDNGSLWVLHPPTLSVFHDTDGDGVSDKSEVLVEGISTSEVGKRGADHTTNGIAMGIDGWIYIAVGDYGFTKAVGTDGRTLSKRGGGVVRVRPDGTELEIYSWGQRNIVDVAIDPYMNIFTRDNTNDGGGWDIRLSHIMQSANYGYPSLYKNFSKEIMPPLADYGGGSGCGAMYFHDERWPQEYNNLLLTCDWGRSMVFSHDLPRNGATFDAQQSDFLKVPRVTDICADGSGRMYVSSWKNGRFGYDGPNVGFVAMVTPIDFTPKPVPEIGSLDDTSLVQTLLHPSAKVRLHVQQEILRRDARLDGQSGNALRTAVTTIARNAEFPLYSRVAAIWTRCQMTSGSSSKILSDLSEDESIRAHCLRALADRKSERVVVKRFLDGAKSNDPNIQAASIIGLGRLLSRTSKDNASDKSLFDQAAAALLELTDVVPRQKFVSGDDWRMPRPQRVIPHLAVAALVSMSAHEVCFAEFRKSSLEERLSDAGDYRDGAYRVLSQLHEKAVVDGLFRLLSTSHLRLNRRDVWTTLIRLYHREGDFVEGESPKWWGTRPDTTGPYYHRVKWSESDRIGEAIKIAMQEANESDRKYLQEQLDRHVVKLDGLSDMDKAAANEPNVAIKLPPVDPNNPNQIANRKPEDVIAAAMKLQGDAEAGKKYFQSQACINCHTYANGQKPKGPHLVDIGKRYKKNELLESILMPGKKIAQGFDTWTFVLASGKVQTGFVVLESAETVTIRQTDGLSHELLQDDIDDRVKQEISMMPKGVAGNLTVEQLADLIAYLQSLH